MVVVLKMMRFLERPSVSDVVSTKMLLSEWFLCESLPALGVDVAAFERSMHGVPETLSLATMRALSSFQITVDFLWKTFI